MVRVPVGFVGLRVAVRWASVRVGPCSDSAAGRHGQDGRAGRIRLPVSGWHFEVPKIGSSAILSDSLGDYGGRSTPRHRLRRTRGGVGRDAFRRLEKAC